MRKLLSVLLCALLLMSCGTALIAHASEQILGNDEQFTTTSAPEVAIFQFVNYTQGYANGQLVITMPEQHNATSFSIYWGDAKGNRLSGYSALMKGPIQGIRTETFLSEGCTVPPAAKTMLVYTYSEKFGECPKPYCINNLPTVTLPDTGKVLAEFQIVSDLHIGSGQAASDRFVAMLGDVVKNCPQSLGIIAAGDSVDAAEDEYYTLLNSLHASVAGAPALYCGIGDHEYLTKDTYAYDPTAHAANLQKFLKNVKRPGGVSINQQYYSCQLGGVTMLFIGADSYQDGKAVYSDNQLTWLRTILSAANQEEPIFVFMHEPLPESVSGSSASQGMGDVHNHEQLKEVLGKYANLYVFSGHTHWTMDAAYTTRNPKTSASFFNAAAVSSLMNTVDGVNQEISGSQGFYVTVYEDAILIRGRDFEKGLWLPESNFLISTIPPKAPATQAPVTVKPVTTTKPASQETEVEQESSLKELIPPLSILATMAVITFIFVFRKPTDTDSEQ